MVNDNNNGKDKSDSNGGANNNNNNNTNGTNQSSSSSSGSAGLSVTCCLTDLSITFYNRLGIKTAADSKYIKSEEKSKCPPPLALSVNFLVLIK